MRDYFDTIDRDGFEVEPYPMRCADCGRPAYWDESDTSYHHASGAEIGCFLIPGEDRPDDLEHPLMKKEEVPA